MFRVEPHGDVSLLRMDDGKVNAIGPAFLRAFGDAWARASEGSRAVVLAGNAKAFSAGLDLKTLPTLPRADLAAFARGFLQAFADVAAHPRPVVAAVDGPALAGGAVLALCADFRVVGPRARLALTEVPVGIPFPAPVAELARRLLPPQEHAPALMRGQAREGEACLRHGWAHEHHPSAELEPRALALAAELADLSPVAYASAKASVLGPVAAHLAAFAKEGADAWADLLLEKETMEGIARGFERMTRRR